MMQAIESLWIYRHIQITKFVSILLSDKNHLSDREINKSKLGNFIVVSETRSHNYNVQFSYSYHNVALFYWFLEYFCRI